nr:MAG TPA: hypothetical protein [Caudoviricetes sp.]
MESEHLITVEKFKELARPTSKHIDDGEVNTFIRECEDMYIIPAIGLERFNSLQKDGQEQKNITLLDGGEFKDKDGRLKKCSGLRLALSYFVYAKMVMSDGGLLTRTGLMQHNDSYASREDDKNRVRMYNDAMEIAENYLGSCLAYLKSIEGDKVSTVRGTRLRIHAIGD